MPYAFYTVQSGDTFSELAENFFGNASLSTLFLNAYGNPVANRHLIFPGELLVWPMIDKHFMYTVQRGDTLSQIAVRFFMRSALYNLILDEDGNPIENPNLIQIGQQLRIPAQAQLPRTGLTPHAIANLSYSGMQLFNGIRTYQGNNPDPTQLSTLAIEQFSYGDLNGFGEWEAAVILSDAPFGATGRFKSLYAVPSVLRPGDSFVNLVGADLGDRVRTDAVHFDRNMLMHVGTGDWPDQTIQRRVFKLFGDANSVGLTFDEDGSDFTFG